MLHLDFIIGVNSKKTSIFDNLAGITNRHSFFTQNYHFFRFMMNNHIDNLMFLTFTKSLSFSIHIIMSDIFHSRRIDS
jgi:hypothetical protein